VTSYHLGMIGQMASSPSALKDQDATVG